MSVSGQGVWRARGRRAQGPVGARQPTDGDFVVVVDVIDRPADKGIVAGLLRADPDAGALDHGEELGSRTAGLRRVGSYKALYRRMAKADRRVALREAPGALQFMVRLRMEGAVVMAHTFTWSEADGDGTWACPPLAIPPPLLQRAASDFASRDLTCFKDFAEWFSSDVTVTAYRELDGRIARLLPETPPELPSEFCCEADYANKVTFTGFEERCANTSLVLGAQFNTTGTLPDLSDSDAFVSVAVQRGHFSPFLWLPAWFVFFPPPPHRPT